MLWPVGSCTADAEMEKRFDEFVRDLRIAGLLTAQMDIRPAPGIVRFLGTAQGVQKTPIHVEKVQVSPERTNDATFL